MHKILGEEEGQLGEEKLGRDGGGAGRKGGRNCEKRRWEQGETKGGNLSLGWKGRRKAKKNNITILNKLHSKQYMPDIVVTMEGLLNRSKWHRKGRCDKSPLLL